MTQSFTTSTEDEHVHSIIIIVIMMREITVCVYMSLNYTL